MAKHRALKIGATTPIVQMEATDAVDNPVNVSGPNVFLGRIDTGEGPHQELTISGLPAETTPEAGDLLLIEVAGVLSKLDIADLPTGGGGNGIYGGSGSLQEGETVAALVNESDILQFDWPGGYIAKFTGEGESIFRALAVADLENGTVGRFYAYDVLTSNRTYTLPNQDGEIKVGVQYKTYTAIVSQSGTSDPTVIVLENGLSDNVVWERTSSGTYTGTLAGAFTADKTAFFFPSIMDMVRTSDDVVTMTSASDGLITTRTIEIRVYP